MDVLAQIKDTISVQSVTQLGDYLEEDRNEVQDGFDLAIAIFLAGVAKFTASDKGGRKLLGILSDGGHTGDILANFEGFSSQPEKLRLLETIGRNITGFFLKDKSTTLAESMAIQTDIKTGSASTLLHLAAPIVLGFLGKRVREQNTSGQELKKWIQGALPALSEVLPLGVYHELNLPRRKADSRIGHYEAVQALNKERSRVSWSMIIPWVLLVFLGGVLWYFSRPKPLDEVTVAKEELVFPEILTPVDTAVEISEPEPPVLTETQTPLAAVPVEEEILLPAEEPEDIPDGLTPVASKAFAQNSAEIVNQEVLAELIDALEGKRILLSPLKRSGRVGVDRAYAIRDYLLERGIRLSQVEVGSPVQGKNASGVVWKILG